MRTWAGMLAVAGLALHAAARAALADPVDALPKTVIADVKALEKQCRDIGGTPGWTAEDLIKPVDLTPDGVPDYVIEAAAMDCEGREVGRAPWTSSGGAQLIVWASVGRNKWAKVFNADVFIWSVS